MHKTLQLLKNGTYSELALGAKPELVHKNNKGVCNPTKVEDHHAILPTLKRPGTLSKDEQNIYDLIVRRFLSHFYPPAEYKQHTVLTEVEKHEFKTSVKELLSLGWKVVLGSNDSEQGASGKKKQKTAMKKRKPRNGPTKRLPYNLTCLFIVRRVSLKRKQPSRPKATPRERCSRQWRAQANRSRMKSCGMR